MEPIHDGHKVTGRFSGLWCDTCNTPVEHDPSFCIECYGKGWKRRMTSIYSGVKGKPYKCGVCKGTGKVAPAVCVHCNDVATMFTAHGQDGQFAPAVHICKSCYDVRKVGKWVPPQF